jgi:phage terminase Nu1 subunit (DNA packaging protein)
MPLMLGGDHSRVSHFDLDHIRAVIAQHERAVRARERACEVEDADAVERAGRLSRHARRVPLSRWRSCFLSFR